MTDEEIKELAREYINGCTKRADFVILTEGILSDFIDLFVAGFMKCSELHEAIKWHDLTKDPNDLPPADPMLPRCSIQVFGTAKTPMHYDFTNREWVSDLSYETVNPIAWYDIPDYEWEN